MSPPSQTVSRQDVAVSRAVSRQDGAVSRQNQGAADAAASATLPPAPSSDALEYPIYAKTSLEFEDLAARFIMCVDLS